MPRRTLATAALAVCAAISMQGCSFIRGGGTKAVEVTLTASERLNPDESGQALPTMFRLQLLTSASKAESASYEEVYRGDKETFGEELVATEEVVLSPGETIKKRVVSEKPARALLVVGIFRKPAGTSWRAIVPLGRGWTRSIAFRAEDYRVDQQ